MIEQAKLIFSPLGKTLEKQTKTFEDQDKKQIKINSRSWKSTFESNELIKKDFNIDIDIAYHLKYILYIIIYIYIYIYIHIYMYI